MSVARCKEEVGGMEFLRWTVWRELYLNTPGKLEYYLAQIAAEVRRGHVKQPKKVRIIDFIIKFTFKALGRPEEPSEEEKKAVATKSSKFWGMLGRFKRIR